MPSWNKACALKLGTPTLTLLFGDIGYRLAPAFGAHWRQCKLHWRHSRLTSSAELEVAQDLSHFVAKPGGILPA